MHRGLSRQFAFLILIALVKVVSSKFAYVNYSFDSLRFDDLTKYIAIFSFNFNIFPYFAALEAPFLDIRVVHTEKQTKGPPLPRKFSP